ncbi:phage virion morphogenesis protein [Stenotrophomonas sp. MMGLT7]|uniref:phage virion morphogenesis protein n=1 Tax=Stenotrophomonas sp. MMGLT7 TaxID=2901227 RepID=UPI001E417605|nr:phage virion morphogenesis protein [Stenotrophomonas sp. MMGLT7]MCD7099111.1 phage virion morphogenesis protein [Stenotrophomonas sp. MMGLT7]
MNPHITIDDTRVQQWLARLASAGRNPRPALVSIGRYGKTSTQMRFRNQVDPDGRRWWPSKRAKATGGQTLADSKNLFRSVVWSVGPGYVEWGTNVIYAAAHNFGIRKFVNVSPHRRRMQGTTKSGRAWAKVVPVKSFTRMMFLPRRQFVGFSAADRAEILDILREFVEDIA